MIDTHTHLYSECFGEGSEQAIERAVLSGVSHLILPNINGKSIGSMREIHSKYPEATSMAMGLHPSDIDENWEDVLKKVEEELKTGEYVAVGEIGIDLHWTQDNLELQKEVFHRQLKIADKFSLPVIIHSRDAFPETLEVIKKANPQVPLIFHSFTGDINDVKLIREVCDPYFGINGVVTYKNAGSLRDALSAIGLKKIILETDSPYLTPAPHRGKKNDSSYLFLVRDKIGEVLNISKEEIEETTDANARHLFKISS